LIVPGRSLKVCLGDDHDRVPVLPALDVVLRHRSAGFIFPPLGGSRMAAFQILPQRRNAFEPQRNARDTKNKRENFLPQRKKSKEKKLLKILIPLFVFFAFFAATLLDFFVNYVSLCGENPSSRTKNARRYHRRLYCGGVWAEAPHYGATSAR